MCKFFNMRKNKKTPEELSRLKDIINEGIDREKERLKKGSDIDNLNEIQESINKEIDSEKENMNNESDIEEITEQQEMFNKEMEARKNKFIDPIQAHIDSVMKAEEAKKKK